MFFIQKNVYVHRLDINKCNACNRPKVRSCAVFKHGSGVINQGIAKVVEKQVLKGTERAEHFSFNAL